MPSLVRLLADGHDVPLVITQPDRPGHRMKVTPPPVKTVAQKVGLEVEQPERIKDPALVDRLRALAPDLIVVIAYGQIVPKAVLEIPRHGVWNVHASLLPRWRGAAPVARAIMAGDATTGVTIMQMDEQLDHGPILAAESVAIAPGEDAPTLTARLAELGADLLTATIARRAELQPVTQDDAEATLAPRLTRQDGELEWEMGATEIDRRVRALQPWPGATLPTRRGRVKVLSGHVDGERYVPDVVQLPGKRPAPAKQVLGDA
ncbi:MAG TPA: methionyl-tRNA formyltransferase [Candidatus Dormibacteraeota bacterium]|nr:methionyl-tRNA formyltransferase [Candidatus Dormibacteraeota bacterium]